MWYIRKKNFEMTSPPFSGKKFLDAHFYSKSAPQGLAPQLLEASYAPAFSPFPFGLIRLGNDLSGKHG
jgi:hypothetical protein